MDSDKPSTSDDNWNTSKFGSNSEENEFYDSLDSVYGFPRNFNMLYNIPPPPPQTN